MADKKRIDKATGTETVGHEWDGIEELDTPMPRWWLWTLYATIVWGIAYTVLFPAWPLLNSATKGLLQWSSRGQYEEEVKLEADRRRPVELALAQVPIEQLAADKKLLNAAVRGGEAAYKINCIQCHGTGAAGSKGYPNLADDDWLWGGDLKAIHQTLEHGIRQPGDDQTRMSQMPAFGRDGVLQPDEIQFVVSYVRTLSGVEKVGAAARRGATIFAANCAVCHGADGRGNRSLGAPNLSDRIWLYGGDRQSITESVVNSRYGMMPSWGQRLDPVTVKMLAAYVHSLGGGEKFAPATDAAGVEGQTEAGAVPASAEQNARR